MKISEIITESRKPAFKLNEVGMNHAEDIIFFEGSAGALRVIQSFKALPKKKDEVLTIKWDGQVALYAGRTADGTFVLTDMAGWGAKGYNGMYTSAKEFIAQKQTKGGNPDFLSKISAIWPIIESAIPPSFRGFIKGDVMWWPGTLKDTGKRWVFGEGTTTYEVEKTSDLGRRVGQGKAGLAIHGYYDASVAGSPEERTSSEPAPLRNTAGLNPNGALCVLGPEIKVEGNVALDSNKIKEVTQYVRKNAKVIDSFLDVNSLKERKLTSLPNMLYTFVNQQTRIRDLDMLAHKFPAWVQSNPKLSKAMAQNVISYLQESGAALQTVFNVFDAVTTLKLDIINQLDNASTTLYAHIKGVKGGEGYVHASDDGHIKLVNRSHFSAANFGNH
jgi:hypothetical protein